MKRTKYPDSDESFVVEETDLKDLLDRPFRLPGGALLLCGQGSGTVTIDAQEFFIAPGSEIILLPGRVLMLAEADSFFHLTSFSFTWQLFNEATHRLDASFFHYLKNNPVYPHREETLPVIKTRFKEAKDVYLDTENRFRCVLARNCLQNILLNIYDKSERHFIRCKAEGYTRREELFHQFIELVVRSCMKEREVAYYADSLCISKSYLASVTREVTGETPKGIIDKHVIQEIKILLASTDYPVQQVADKIHFPDQSYLGRYFRHHTGQSPTEYRNVSNRS